MCAFISTSRNASCVASSGVWKSGRWSTGESGIRFTLHDGSVFRRRTSSSAQARESFSPFTSVYSNVITRPVARV